MARPPQQRSPQAAAKAPAAKAPAAPRRPAHEVRIIGGLWKRSRLPVADRPGLRPTPDRVRETLFNWLGQDLAGWQVVDAFAGTGALGLEAASRGAARVVLVEQETAQAQGLQAVVERLAGANQVVQVTRGSGIAVLQRQAPASLDLVLLDPPFDAGLYEPALAAAIPALKTGGWLYLEAPRAWEVEARGARLALRRHLKAGAVHAHLFEKVDPAASAEAPAPAPQAA